MKLQVAALALSAMAVILAGAAAAQGYGTFDPNGRRPPAPPPPGFGPPAGYGAQETPGASVAGRAHRSSWSEIEEPKAAKPYEPPKLGPSPYSTPKPGPQGAKPCELSVYVHACDHHH